MPITLLSGPANAGKAQAVLDAVRAHIARGEQPLLVVPTRADVDRYVRELAGEGTLMGARAMRFDGLQYEVVRRAGLGDAVLGERARERVLGLLVREAGLAEAGEQPPSPGLARGARELLDELQVRRIAPARFARALADWAAQDPEHASGRPELARLYGAYEQQLERLGRVDRRGRVVRALDALRRSPALWEATPVLIYGFDDLTPLQLDTVESLGRVVDTQLTVSLSFEPGRSAFAGRAATFAALAPLAAEQRTLQARIDYYAPRSREALGHLERSLFEPGARRASSDGALVLLEGGGERAELELVAHEIAGLIGGGTAPEEIALAVRSPDAVAELLEEVLAAAGVPYALQRRRRLSDSAIGRALIGLLRCVPRTRRAAAAEAEAPAGPPAGSGADLLAWLRAPGLLSTPALADGLERDARRRGLTSASQLRSLWEQRHWELEPIDRLAEAQQGSPLRLIERAERELAWLLAAPRRRSASVLGSAEGDEGRAHAAALRALEELRELGELDDQLLPGDAWALAGELEGVEFVGGEPPAAGAVAVSDPLALRARRVRALFLCGLQEGVFPARPRRPGLLSDEQRRRLAEASGLLLGEQHDALAAERYLLYAAVSRPEELLVLSWHVADDDGSPTARSLFVEDVCDLFEEELLEQPRRRALGALQDTGNFGAFAGDSLAGDALAGDTVAGEVFAGAAPAGGEAHAGLGDERVLEELRARTWSASQLENLISCPVRWYVERVLRPGEYEPEAEPLRRGGLAHAALNDALEGLRARTGSAALTPGSLPQARELLREALAAREQEFPLSVAPERLPGARLRLRSELERYLEHAARQQCVLEPGPLELSFGFPDEQAASEDAEPLAAFDLGSGVMLRGRIDRIDLAPAGDAVVVDYKSRFAPAPGRWISDGKVQVALYMRAVETLLSVRVAGGFYQPLSGPDLRARGVLDEDAGIELDCVRGDVRGRDEMRQLLDEALAAARSAALAAQRGELEPRPQTCSPNGCSYPSICRCRP